MQATHIFDGLESWPTHLMYLARGELQLFKACVDIPELENGRLMRLVEGCVMQPSRLRTWGIGPHCLKRSEVPGASCGLCPAGMS